MKAINDLEEINDRGVEDIGQAFIHAQLERVLPFSGGSSLVNPPLDTVFSFSFSFFFYNLDPCALARSFSMETMYV